MDIRHNYETKQIVQLIVNLKGELSDGEAEQFDVYCDGLLRSDNDFDELVLDFNRVPFIRSVGIGKLIALYGKIHNKGKAISIINCNEIIFKQFEISKLDRLFIFKKIEK